MEKMEQGYILRYYLPVKPSYNEEYTQKRFSELLDFCAKAKVKAVMFFVALAPDYYYMPDAPEYAEKWKEQMLPYIKRLKDAGISYQLNFQNTMGATTKGLDFSGIYGWENLVDQNGRESKGCACPLGKEFRRQTGARLKTWAETKPDIIWLDDDFRLHNHGTPLGAVLDGDVPYADYYCFCEEHLRLFNERNNSSFTREKLVTEMMNKGKASDIRRKYLDFLSDTMVETAHWMENTIHSISPETKIALMTSRPDVHTAEGRRWDKLLPALCGEYTPILRPTFGPYKDQEQPIKDFVDAYRQFGMLKAQIRESDICDVEYCPEIENTQFTVWAKSTAATEFQLALSAFMGCRDITLSIYDLDGGAFFDEPAYEKMLAKQKSFLDKIVALDLGKEQEQGVAILVTGNSGRTYMLNEGETYEHIGGKTRYIDKYFLQMGIPCKYVTPSELDDADIVALDGYSAAFLTDEEIRSILTKSIFLEGDAAEILFKRGFGEMIGFKKIIGKAKLPVQAEEILTDFKRIDGTAIRMPTRITINNWYHVELLEETKLLSVFVTPLGEREAAMTYFENSLGGKIVTYTARNNFSSAFFNHSRVRFFKQILRQLKKDMPQIDCNSYTLSVLKQKSNGEKYYFIANLSSDVTEEFSINGKSIRMQLGVYGAAVLCERDEDLVLIGTTETRM